MTDFIVTITDPDQLAGITWAREQYNATIPPPPPPPMNGDTVTGMTAPPPMMAGQQSATAIETDEAYVQWVMGQAAISYADQKLRDEHRQNYENEVASRSGGKNA